MGIKIIIGIAIWFILLGAILLFFAGADKLNNIDDDDYY